MAFPGNCGVRILNVDASCGCTLTRASVEGMTPQMFEDQGLKEVYMDRVIARAVEAKAVGVVENTLEMLLMGRFANIKGQLQTQKVSNESIILPYVYRRQKRNINSNYWRVIAGVATTGAGTGAIPASAMDLTLTNTQSPWASALVGLENYFLPGKYIQIETLGSGGEAVAPQFRILSSVNANGGGQERAKITVQPNVTDTEWAAMSAAEKAVYQVDDGIAFVLANSVSDYESWCYNDVAENTRNLLAFWLQTSRETFCYNDEYLKALNHALMSNFFRDFRMLPLAEQKRIQALKARRDWFNSIFYGQEIDEHQTVEGYASLPKVRDPNNPDCVLEYKANALGFKTQLQKCGRYLDHQGNPLSLDFLLEIGYNLKRSREASGGTVDTIDLMTDRFTAGAILELFAGDNGFYKKKYGVSTTRFYQPGQRLQFAPNVNLIYNLYELPPDLGGYNLAVFTHPYFDDKISAFDPALQNRGRTAWLIDWSDLTIGIAGTSSVSRRQPDPETSALYACVIQANINHYQLNSTRWTAILEDPTRHYIIDNFSSACPTLTVDPCVPYET